jgi:O-antigen ligase
MNFNTIRNYWFYAALSLLIAGIFLIDVARVVPSLSMILICLLGISYIFKPSEHKLNDAKIWLALSFTFILTLPSILYSENVAYLLERWQILLPYLLLPLAFYLIPKAQDKIYYRLYASFVVFTTLVCAYAFGFYLLNQNLVNQLYLESKVMPTFVTHHPSLSIMVVMAIYLGYHLAKNKLETGLPYQQAILYGLSAFLFIFIHVFSVRSGLLALYAVITVELLQIILIKKQVKFALIAALVIGFAGGITLFVSPTVRNKITNTAQDLQVVKENKSANNQSLASRMISYKNALQIAKESSIWIGCGLGDIQDLNNEIFEKQYPEVIKKILPHNQFLFYYAAIGLIGVVLFITLFYFPLFYKKAWHSPILLVQYTILTIAFMFEAPLENQLGVAFSLIFILMPLLPSTGVEKLALEVPLPSCASAFTASRCLPKPE